MKRTFRVFISSTFTDFVRERNYLHEFIWPQVHAAAGQLGARFVPIDLRWGIAQSASLAHATVDICLTELERCRRASPGAYCLMLLGQRYGWRPPPPRLPMALMEQLRTALPGAILGCYQLDRNAIPAHWHLLPATLWPRWEGQSMTEATLIRHLYGAVAAVGLQQHRLFRSITHQEVAAALANQPDGVRVYIRTLTGLDQHPEPWLLSDEFAPRLIVPGGADRQQTMLDEIRRSTDRVAEFTVDATDNTSWDRYLAELGESVRCDLVDSMADTLDSASELTGAMESAEREVTAAAFVSSRRAIIVGRESIIDELARRPGDVACAPVAVVADSGTGKSSVLAEVAARLADECCVVARFIGAVPGLSDLPSLLQDLTTAAVDVVGRSPDHVPGTDLAEVLPALFTLASPDRPLVIVLDGIDQLSADHGAHDYRWLPDLVPPHCGLLVSTVSGVMWDRLVTARPGVRAVPLDPLTQEDAPLIVEKLLARHGRTVTEAQMTAVVSTCAPVGLWFVLAAERVRALSSSDPVPHLPSTIDGCINAVITGWQRDHGDLLVRTVLATLAASREGLTEDELEFVLGMDPEVRAEFVERSHHSWPEQERVLPGVVWARLRADLQPYLTDHLRGGHPTIRLFHQAFIDVVRERFVNPIDDADIKVHRMLERLFRSQQSAGVLASARARAELEAQWHSQRAVVALPVSTGVTAAETGPARLLELADGGDGSAMFRLALRESRPSERRFWIRRAAEAGFTPAMVNLGTMLEGTDQPMALAWYRRAAGAGDSQAAVNLARMTTVTVSQGGSPKDSAVDPDSAGASGDGIAELLRRAACAYAAGKTLAARRLWEEAAREGSAEAIGWLGDIADDMGDAAAAIIKWERSAEAGDVRAMGRRAAAAAAAGEGATARRFWEMAASRDSVHAMVELGLLARSAGDHDAAVAYWRRAADRGDSRAAALLHGASGRVTPGAGV